MTTPDASVAAGVGAPRSPSPAAFQSVSWKVLDGGRPPIVYDVAVAETDAQNGLRLYRLEPALEVFSVDEGIENVI